MSAFPEMSATRTSLEQYAVNCLIMVWTCWPSSLVGTRIRAFTSCSRTLWTSQTQRKWSGKQKRQHTRGYWVHIGERNTADSYFCSSIVKVPFPNQWCSSPRLFGCQDTLNDRYSISSCLSRSGPCSGQQILSIQGQRNGFLLDQSGLGPTQVSNRLQWGQWQKSFTFLFSCYCHKTVLLLL